LKKKIIIILIALAVVFYVFSAVNYSLKPKIALIRIEGVISDYYETVKIINQAKKDESIKAVVIKVDSPGGAVGASQEIYRAIEKLRDKKPVIVSMGNVAASGGYYVSAAATEIFANPGTITGSIGVIIQHVDFSNVLKKLGIKVNNIKSGKNKDILYPNRPLTPEQKKLLEKTVMDVYDQFLNAITKYRPIAKEVLRKYADGRVFSGREAKKLNLIDKIGNIEDAIEEAKNKSQFKDAIVVEFRKKPKFLEQLLGSEIHIKDLPKSGMYYLMSF
jgi:protease-4